MNDEICVAILGEALLLCEPEEMMKIDHFLVLPALLRDFLRH
jgi:hypothetical protein